MIGVSKDCGEFHTKADRSEHGNGRWKKWDGENPYDPERRHKRRIVKQELHRELMTEDEDHR